MPALPFAKVGTIKTRPDSTVAADVPCMVWPINGRTDDAGVHWDHQGEAPLSYYAALREPNRLLEVEGTQYVVVQATAHPFVPHVALRLRETRSSGR